MTKCCRLRVKSVTSVVEAYPTRPTKRRPVKYCTYILLGRLTVGKQRNTYEPPRMRSNAVGGGDTRLAWVVATMMPLQYDPGQNHGLMKPLVLLWF